jgi:hypothetical protein
MADEKFDIGKLLRGFNVFKGEVLGKIIFYVVIACIVCGVFYVLFVRPTHKTTQTGTITNVTEIKQDSNEIQVLPPKVKLGNTVLKLLWF